MDWGNANVLQGAANSLAATAAGNAQKPIADSAAGVTKSAVAAGTVTIADGAAQQARTGETAEETVASLSIDKIFDAQRVRDQQELSQLKNQVAQQAAPLIYQKVGDVLVGSSPETKAAVHALVGGLMSRALGGSFAAGAAASLAMEAFGKALLDQPGLSENDRKALVRLAGLVVGGVAGGAAGGSASDVAAGANSGKVATENNYLNHTQKRERAGAYAECKDDTCRKQVQAEFAKKWEANRTSVENCTSQSRCLSVATALRIEQQEQGQRIADLQAKGPSTWTEAERIEYADLRFGYSSINQMHTAALANSAKFGTANSIDSKETQNLIADVGIGVVPGISISTIEISLKIRSTGNLLVTIFLIL
ncbi:VENN motif pre-toxin domain-containing protein [Cupriavidus sp.]|uniref:VENN motif pre-toxin domain-containing protein n=1 Tax=Cupriavidus sp. TaxID=1873897 RepID=UPI0004502CF7